jgi:G3E family GTPase
LKQLTYGDIIILNKTDLVTPKKLQELEAYIHDVKASAKILHSTYGQVPLPLILGVGLNSQVICGCEDDTHEHHHHEHHHHEHHHHEHHHHKHHHHEHHHHGHHSHHLENDGFMSISFQSDRPFDVNKFEAFLTEDMPAEVFRAKGFLWFNDSELRHIFQLSGLRYHLYADEWTTTPKNQLVIIGRHLNTQEITSLLNKCLVTDNS